MGYTRKAIATRGRILDCAAGLMFEKGFDQTKLSEVLNGSRVQKGNFYYYFASKDELGLAVMRERGKQVVQSWLDSVLDNGRPPLDNIRDLARRVFDEAGATQNMNPLSHLILELGRSNGEYRQSIIETLDDVSARLTTEFTRLKTSGGSTVDADPETLAVFVFDLLRGAVLQRHVTGDAHSSWRSVETGLTCVEQGLA